ncbi:receptor-like protein kinase 5 [Phragmites australis]|uniref:receptor-like protein kinase 5 n=1 Tax=Phragmites australis TaxID=29695 RepID=UPI002D794DB1|nr:receptor-like protein kinase 5 [Phragmites australis]
MAPSPRAHACLRVLVLSCVCLALPCLPRHAAAQPAAAPADEAQLLLQIKRAWGDPAPLASWGAANGATHCNWAYVSCDAAGRVTSLALPNVTLAGTVPEAIGGLSGLTVLDLHNTSVGGGFPAFLYNLTGITSINLSKNQLGGELPADIGRLGAGGNLTYLALDHNNFTGEIPAAVSKLKRLTYLALNENQLTGTIPPELGELTSLQTLKLEVNPFGAGILPQSFKNLTKLRTVWMGQCKLTGEFPSYVTEMSEIEWLDLSGNAFTGSIPSGIWNLQKLQYLYLYKNNLSGDLVINGPIGATGLVEVDLSENQLSGTISESFGSLVNLRLLNLHQNYLSGEIPASIVQLPSLVFLWLWSNNLTGVLPAELGKQTPLLRDIQIDENDFYGPIPVGICDHRQLWVLTASGNRLNGSIPTSLANCPALIWLQLQDNDLSGEVPAALWTETKLTTLYLHNNGQLGGSLPEKLYWNLTRLFIDNNRFTGRLPASAPRLQKFHAGNNLFSGDIPAGFVAGMPLLQELDLSVNQLSGAIPANIASISGLSQMNFSNNQLTGEIPAGLGSMPVLTLLDLSSNQLSGAIPPALGSLRVNQLNLSSNQLTGEVPVALATSANDRSFLANPGLCTAAPSSVYLTGVRSCAANSSDHVSPRLRAGLLAAGAALLVVIAALAFFVVRDIKRRNRRLVQAEEAWKLTPFHPLDFGEASVLRGLSDENLIGKGGSGRVYRVAYTSRSSGCMGGTVAVKRIWTGRKLNKNLEREFASEVDILGHIRHTNIVKLLCCLSRAETKLLVYEYMDNGSLDKWLHGDKWLAGSAMARAPSVRRAPLDWPTRVRVAVGAARGLCYMHHECSPPIVHRDVKSSNILLDSEFHAKVADFGLARMLVQAGAPDNVSAVAGTFGYTAPECAYTRKVNEKVDVYSFGVVLLELSTGREANDGGEHGSLAEWAWRHLQSGKRIADAADKCLSDAGYGDDVEAVFKLGIICTGAQPSTRPTMKDVLQILLRCEQAHQKTVDENVANYDAAPLLQVRGGSRRKQLSDAKGVDKGKGGLDCEV